jgi:hypothetical protein
MSLYGLPLVQLLRTFNTWLLGSKEHWFHHNLMRNGPKVKNVSAIGIYTPSAMPWCWVKLVEVIGTILAAWTALHMCVSALNCTAMLHPNPPYSMGFGVRHPPWWGITLSWHCQDKRYTWCSDLKCPMSLYGLPLVQLPHFQHVAARKQGTLISP